MGATYPAATPSVFAWGVWAFMHGDAVSDWHVPSSDEALQDVRSPVVHPRRRQFAAIHLPLEAHTLYQASSNKGTKLSRRE